MTEQHVTCNSFPWNKTGEFRTPILCPNMDKNKVEAAHVGNAQAPSYVTSNYGNFETRKTPALNRSLTLQGHQLLNRLN